MKKQESATRFLELVQETKKTNKDIAELLGVHERTFYRWVSGDSRVPISAIKVLELLKPAE